MPTKRTLLVTAVLALLVAASGCSALQGGPSAATPTPDDGGDVRAEQVLNRTQQGISDLESFTFDANITMSSNATGQSRTVSATGAVNVTAGDLRAKIDGPAQSVTMYVVNETAYMKLQGAWIKLPAANTTSGMESTPTPASQNQQFLNATNVSFVGNTTINGTEVYELSVTVDEAQLMNALEQQGQGVASGLSFRNVSYTIYVTHDEHRLKRLTADTTMTYQGQTRDATVIVTLDNFNEPLSIDLPAAAENARTFGQTGS